MTNRLDGFLKRVLEIETVLSVALLSALVLLIGIQVFLRYLFNNPFAWAEELAALLLIYLSFITGDVVYKKNAHISIDYAVGFLPARLRALTEIALGVAICICLSTLTVVSIPLIRDQFGFTIAAALPLSKSWWTMPVPIVFCSMILTTVNLILHRCATLRVRPAA